jgi:hypothetical protein
LFVLDDLKDLAARPKQLSSLGEQPGILCEVGDEFPHVVTFDFEAQSPDGRSLLPLLLAVEVCGLLRANRQLGGDAGQATTRESLDLLQGRVDLANGAVRARVDAADTSQAREVCQHEA